MACEKRASDHRSEGIQYAAASRSCPCVIAGITGSPAFAG